MIVNISEESSSWLSYGLRNDLTWRFSSAGANKDCILFAFVEIQILTYSENQKQATPSQQVHLPPNPNMKDTHNDTDIVNI